MLWSENPTGFLYETQDFQILMGHKGSNLTALRQHFPSISWSKVHQVHGVEVKRGPGWLETPPQADGQWSDQAQQGLLISTADCVPIFLFHPRPRRVLALHAGWKGVAGRILPESLELLKTEGPKSDWLMFLGPHIAKQSFEIGPEVRALLEKSCPGKTLEGCFKPGAGDRIFADLGQILREQAESAGISERQIFELEIDTMKDLRFHSYRRDGTQSGRNLSWIALK